MAKPKVKTQDPSRTGWQNARLAACFLFSCSLQIDIRPGGAYTHRHLYLRTSNSGTMVQLGHNAAKLVLDGAGCRPITCPLGVWLGQANAWPDRVSTWTLLTGQ